VKEKIANKDTKKKETNVNVSEKKDFAFIKERPVFRKRLPMLKEKEK
jgi:hypothetical protein